MPMPGAAVPEVQAIEAALPRLASDLAGARAQLASEIGQRAAAADAPTPSPAALEQALTRWLALRVANALAIAVPDAGARARIADELEDRVSGDAPATRLDEPEVARVVSEALADPLHLDALHERIDSAATVAVRHVLLGGPAPEAAHRAPRPEETAGMGRRLVAFLLDYSLVLCLGFVGGMLQVLVGGPLEKLDDQFLGYLLVAVGALVNMQLLATTGTTLGKLALGLEVVSAGDGGRPDLVTAFRREVLGRFLNQVLLGIGYLAGLRHPLHQTWGDRLARTAVIRLRRPRGWQTWARTATFATTLTALLYFPALLVFGSLDQEAAALIQAESDLVSLADSVYTLSSRPVLTDEEMAEDMRGVASLAPSVRDRARKIRGHTSRLLTMSRLLAPWQSGEIARIDSMYVMVERCMVSAEELATNTLAADGGADSEAPALRRRAQYAASDLEADHDYLRLLVTRVSGRSEDG